MALFQTPFAIPSVDISIPYDASADGKRFLFIAPVSTTSSSSAAAATDPGTITAVVNWTATLRKK